MILQDSLSEKVKSPKSRLVFGRTNFVVYWRLYMANGAPPPVQQYSLKGPQVEPGAGYWMYCSQLHIPTIDELTQFTEDPHSPHFFPAPPDADVTAREFAELLELAQWRDDPCRLVNVKPCKERNLIPCKFPQELPMAFGCRRSISKLLNLQPPALGAVMVN